MKSYTKVVFVDSKERRSLPRKVSSALNSIGGSLPLLVFLSPDGEIKLGSFNHASLKGQEYRKIFKETKKKIKDTKKEGGFKNSGVAGKTDDANKADASDKAESDAVMIANPVERTWTSSKGREIKAKLIKFEDGAYSLKTSKGRVITVKAGDLNTASVVLAQEIIDNNK